MELYDLATSIKEHGLSNKLVNKMSYSINAQTIANIYAEKGFKNTSKWLIFSLKNRDSPFNQDLQDIIRSFRTEFRLYQREIYNNPEFNADCFETIFRTIIAGMSSGQAKFYNLTTKLIPLIGRIIENNKRMNDLMTDVVTLSYEAKYNRFCHYYQNLWEGDYKYVRRTLLAMKRLKEGKSITITETLALLSDETNIEPKASLQEVTPERLRIGEHEHLRHAIAHSNYKFIKEEEKMEFWDVNTRTQKYSWGPKKFTLRDFSVPLIEVDLFCEVYGLHVLLLLALEHISETKIKPKKP